MLVFGFGADPEDTFEAADTLTSAQGSSVFKAGGGFKYVRARNAFLNYGRGAYFFGGPPDLFPTPVSVRSGTGSRREDRHRRSAGVFQPSRRQGDLKSGRN